MKLPANPTVKTGTSLIGLCFDEIHNIKHIHKHININECDAYALMYFLMNDMLPKHSLVKIIVRRANIL